MCGQEFEPCGFFSLLHFDVEGDYLHIDKC